MKKILTINELIEQLESMKKYNPMMCDEPIFFKSKDGELTLLGDVEVNCNHTISINEETDEKVLNMYLS